MTWFWNRQTFPKNKPLRGIVEIFLAITELFYESGNVYIETKRNVGPYIAFYASLRGHMAEKSGLVLTTTISSSYSSTTNYYFYYFFYYY
jgi:hypothetical protein